MNNKYMTELTLDDLQKYHNKINEYKIYKKGLNKELDYCENKTLEDRNQIINGLKNGEKYFILQDFISHDFLSQELVDWEEDNNNEI